MTASRATESLPRPSGAASRSLARTSAVVGINWGDEGKGRMVDYLAQEADVVVRYQGGNNAGHTVVNSYGEFKLHLVPAGVFNQRALNVLGPGMVVDLEGLVDELESLSAAGVSAWENVRVSDRAAVCFPFHRLEDELEEERLSERPYGSTRRGIAPAYGDRYLKKAIQVGELVEGEAWLRERIAWVVEWKAGLLRRRYGVDPAALVEETVAWTLEYGRRIAPLVCDTTQLLRTALRDGSKILFEAQLGALRDVFFGTYPMTTSSNCLASYAPVGSGLYGLPERVVGVVKAFSTCVGEGPFVTEMDPREAADLREVSNEYGAATGRPRRIGHFDAVASRYGVAVQGANELALTKLDSLSGRRELLIATAYDVDGSRLSSFPLNPQLERATPVYERVPGWEEDVSGVRRYADLPAAAQAYVERIEELVDCEIRYVSVGPERDALIDRRLS